MNRLLNFTKLSKILASLRSCKKVLLSFTTLSTISTTSSLRLRTIDKSFVFLAIFTTLLIVLRFTQGISFKCAYFCSVINEIHENCKNMQYK